MLSLEQLVIRLTVATLLGALVGAPNVNGWSEPRACGLTRWSGSARACSCRPRDAHSRGNAALLLSTRLLLHLDADVEDLIGGTLVDAAQR